MALDSNPIGRIGAYAEKHNLSIDWYPGYAEPGHPTDIPVLAANWNGPGEYERNYDARWNGTRPGETGPMARAKVRMLKLGKLVEKLRDKGICGIEWSDEWSGCSECNKAVRTEPTGYCWEPAYKFVDGEFLCLKCYADTVCNGNAGEEEE